MFIPFAPSQKLHLLFCQDSIEVLTEAPGVEAPVDGSKGRDGSAATRSNTVRFGLVTPEMESQLLTSSIQRLPGGTFTFLLRKISRRQYGLPFYRTEYIWVSHDSSPTLTILGGFHQPRYRDTSRTSGSVLLGMVVVEGK